MATHTNSGGGSYARKFQIAREDSKKDGKPYFFEYLKGIPANPEQYRKFEKRKRDNGEMAYYELFGAIDAKLVGIRIAEKKIKDKTEKRLCLDLQDGAEDYILELDSPDGRYSLDFMKRILDPKFDPAKILRFSPFAIANGADRQNIGLSIMHLPDLKLNSRVKASEYGEANPGLAGMPDAKKVEFKGEEKWDFYPMALWLYNQVMEKIVPRLHADPISFKQPVNIPSGGPFNTNPEQVGVIEGGDEVVTDGNDLPF